MLSVLWNILLIPHILCYKVWYMALNTHNSEIKMLYYGDSGFQSLAKSVLKCNSNSEVAQRNTT